MRVLKSFISICLIQALALTSQAQQGSPLILNDTTELQDLGNGKSLKVSYRLSTGKTLLISEKEKFLEEYPAMRREFRINKEDQSGWVILFLPESVKETGTIVKPTDHHPNTSKIDIGTDVTGKPFPEFNWTSVDKINYSLNAMRGKVIVLNFWHTSCVPCIAEMPLLNEITAKYAAKDVVFLASTPNSREELLQFLKKKKFTYKQVAAVDPKLFFDPMPGWPLHVVIDKAGKINFLVLGKQPQIEKKLTEAIDAALIK